ncbi:hypothetical protein FE257_013066 [Aspergillus nanangensis]|uniref:Heterokaryon incompatibility domain-containing protein n=1 Tax=Aspergillus nanangensis TaxID=2582783 RepID=A0AAD4GRC1_ASPNN|nr:hypothetical protein FE257_013066 [Aspergillus nanangensis]
MHLLNAKTRRLEEFFESEAPPYAILSHTWGKDEVSFQDIQDPSPPGFRTSDRGRPFDQTTKKPSDGRPTTDYSDEIPTSDKHTKKLGYDKIIKTCQQALEDGFAYVWIDTCCIDKSSSAELSEAINSMFRWYKQAEVCYAFLVDVLPSSSSISESRWFTRGWTLQELLAPRKLIFFASDWSCIATREELSEEISTITGIERWFLDDYGTHDSRSSRYRYDSRYNPDIQSRSMDCASIATKMSWASSRRTTRLEDMAYCLLGIFGVSMPLLYGEGERAFLRLQEEIMKHSDDQSIFAWNQDIGPGRLVSMTGYHGILTPSPAAFSGCASITARMDGKSSHFNFTNKGVQIQLPISEGTTGYALLQCHHTSGPTTLLAIPVRRLEDDLYERVEGNLISVDRRTLQWWPTKNVYLSSHRQPDQRQISLSNYGIYSENLPNYGMYAEGIPDFVSIQRLQWKIARDGSSTMYSWMDSSGLEHRNAVSIDHTSENGKTNVKLHCMLTRPNFSDQSLSSGVNVYLLEIPHEYPFPTRRAEDYQLTVEPARNDMPVEDYILYSKLRLQKIGGEPFIVIDISFTCLIRGPLWYLDYRWLSGPAEVSSSRNPIFAMIASLAVKIVCYDNSAEYQEVAKDKSLPRFDTSEDLL